MKTQFISRFKTGMAALLALALVLSWCLVPLPARAEETLPAEATETGNGYYRYQAEHFYHKTTNNGHAADWEQNTVMNIPLNANSEFTAGKYVLSLRTCGNPTAIRIQVNGNDVGTVSRAGTGFEPSALTCNALQTVLDLKPEDVITVVGPTPSEGWGWVDYLQLDFYVSQLTIEAENYYHSKDGSGTAANWLQNEKFDVELSTVEGFTAGKYRLMLRSCGNPTSIRVQVNGTDVGTVSRNGNGFGLDQMTDDLMNTVLELKETDVLTVIGPTSDEGWGWVDYIRLYTHLDLLPEGATESGEGWYRYQAEYYYDKTTGEGQAADWVQGTTMHFPVATIRSFAPGQYKLMLRSCGNPTAVKILVNGTQVGVIHRAGTGFGMEAMTNDVLSEVLTLSYGDVITVVGPTSDEGWGWVDYIQLDAFVEDDTPIVNSFDPNTAFNGYLNDDGSEVSFAGHYTSDFIAVHPSDVVYMAPCNPAQGYHLLAFNGEKKAITPVRGDRLTAMETLDNGMVIYAYTVTDGTAYIRVSNDASVHKDFVVTINQRLNSEKLEAYWAAHQEPQPDMSGTALYEKTVLFSGDSISYGAGDSSAYRAWAGRIGYKYSMDWINASVCGASVSTVRGNNRMLTQLSKHIDKSFDFVILHGGTNDAWENVPVGQMADTFDLADFDPDTFAGGLEELFYFAKQHFRDAQLGFVINFKFNDDVNIGSLADMSEYVAITKEICDKWSIPYLDLYSNAELSAALKLNTSEHTTLVPDKVHPNDAGYEIITPYIEAWMNEVVATQEQVANPTPKPNPSYKIEAESATFDPEDKMESGTNAQGDHWISGYNNTVATYIVPEGVAAGKYVISALYVSAVDRAAELQIVCGEQKLSTAWSRTSEWDWNEAAFLKVGVLELKAGDTFKVNAIGDSPWIQIDYFLLTPEGADGPENPDQPDPPDQPDQPDDPTLPDGAVESGDGWHQYQAEYFYDGNISENAAADLQPGETLEIPVDAAKNFAEGEYTLTVRSCGNRESFEILVNGKSVGTVTRTGTGFGMDQMTDDKLSKTITLKPGDVIGLKAPSGEIWGWVDCITLDLKRDLPVGDDDRTYAKIEAESGSFDPASGKESGTSDAGQSWISGFQNMTASYTIPDSVKPGLYRLYMGYVTPTSDCSISVGFGGGERSIKVTPSDNADAWNWENAKLGTLMDLYIKPGDTFTIRTTGSTPWVQIDYFLLIPLGEDGKPLPGSVPDGLYIPVTGDTVPVCALGAVLLLSAVGLAVVVSKRKELI